jgi:peptidoglycan hydrolase-like protein with peptidoglycan-binding domain
MGELFRLWSNGRPSGVPAPHTGRVISNIADGGSTLFSRRLISALVGAAIASAGIISVNAPASADVGPLAQCTGTVRIVTNTVDYPAHIPASGSTAASTNCTMSRGSTGSAVRALQLTLRDCYAQDIAVDSRFGRATARALRVAQRAYNITADGVYGPQTRDALFHLTTLTSWCSTIAQPPRLG